MKHGALLIQPLLSRLLNLLLSLRGLPLRDAVRSLHDAGFRVKLVRDAASGTVPASGTLALPGTLVQLHYLR